MIVINRLSLAHRTDGRVMVQPFDCTIQKGDKVGIIGEEGTGKSSLLHVLAHSSSLDAYMTVTGHVQVQAHCVAFIPQMPSKSWQQQRLKDYLFDETHAAHLDMNEVYELASKLRFAPDLWDNTLLCGQLSGGEQFKAQLIYWAARHPDLVLLDEPTNDLDEHSRRWLTQWIRQQAAAVVFVSHDEAFLAQTAARIIHVQTHHHRQQSQVVVADKPYTEYQTLYEQQLHKQLQVARKQRAEYQQQMERYRRIESAAQYNLRHTHDAAKGRLAAKKMKAVKSLERRFEREAHQMVAIPMRDEASVIKIRCTQPLPLRKSVVSLYGESLYRADTLLATDLSLEVKGRDKIGITGQNGVGKSTFLEQVAQRLQQQTDWRIAYMPQQVDRVWNQDETAVAFLTRVAHPDKVPFVRDYLGSAQFAIEEMERPIASLSGGQQGKVLLLYLDLCDAAVLLLDEPTRHFSALSQPAVRAALQQFPGCVIAISHDPLLLTAVCSQCYELTPSGFVSQSLTS